MSRRACGCFVLLLSSAFAAQTRAAAPTCTVSSPGIVFGNYDPTSTAPVSVIGSGNLICTYTGTGFTATIAASTGTSGSYANRTMVLATRTLTYNLYLDPGHTLILGNGSAGTYDFTVCYPGGTVTCSGPSGQNGATYSAPVFGLLPAGQNVRAGTYSDSIVVTVTF